MVRIGCLAAVLVLMGGTVRAQDVPGIELCTHETRMDKRTGCLQSNIDYLHQLIAKNAADAQQRLSAATNEIGALKAALASLQASVDKLQAAAKKPETPASKPEAK